MSASRPSNLLLLSFALTALALGCGTGGTFFDAGGDAALGETSVACGEADQDADGIPDRYEGTADTDSDGTPNLRDTDSDGDGRSDQLEALAGRAYSCMAPPLDTDTDGKPDFLDTDSDNNGITDNMDFRGTGDMPPNGGWEANPADFDVDGTPNYADLDDDNDGINDTEELGTPTAPVDTDRDGTPDFHDIDSDGDTVRDRDETGLDTDNDGTPNFRDLDSDGDSFPDTMEAGDNNPSTPPVECADELDAATLSTRRPDGLPDFRDIDSDNDGLSDREEMTAGTNRCDPDSDDDGQLDSAETIWCMRNRRMNCATDRGITIPSTDYYLILPYRGQQVVRELEFGTNIRVADVFFIFDTTGSMSSVQQAVANTIGTPNIGLVDSISRIIPNAWFGVGHYDDFPSGGFGSGSDRALHPLCDGAPMSRTTPECGSRYGGIIMQPPTSAMDVQAGARAIPGGSGNDVPESQTEALYQIVTNEGLVDTARGCASPGTNGCWVVPTACPEGRWGFPCFRDGSLAVVVHYTDADFHNGARAIGGTTFYSPYTGITPTPHTFDQMLMAFQRRGARQISINANSTRCEGTVPMARTTNNPCFDFRMAAEGTGSVDVSGNALIYDLPRTGSSAPPAELVSVVTNAVTTLATRVPLDITTGLRNDPMNPNRIDATRFIKRRVPSCEVAPRNRMCWTEAMDIEHDLAVARTDSTTFYRVVPGTRVRFTIYFQNDVYEGAPSGVTLFHAYIDVLGDGSNRLDEREVFILVPAYQPPIG